MKTALPSLLCLLLAACGGGGGDEPACSSRVQLIGDSTQEQQRNNLQRALGSVSVINMGVGGTTAAQAPAVDAGAVSIVNYGINDMRLGVSVEQYKAALRKINASAYETPSPPYDGYAQAMREVAAELGRPVIDVSAYVRSLPGWEARVPDGVHPDAGLYEEITQRVVAPAVAKMVCQ